MSLWPSRWEDQAKLERSLAGACPKGRSGRQTKSGASGSELLVSRKHVPDRVGEPAGEWWFDVRTGVVDEGHRAPGRDLLGPYPTRAEAEQALDLARRRTEAWEAEERAED